MQCPIPDASFRIVTADGASTWNSGEAVGFTVGDGTGGQTYNGRVRLQLQASSTGHASYEWRVDGAVVGTGPSLTYDFRAGSQATTPYAVTLTVRDASGAEATASSAVSITKRHGGTEPLAHAVLDPFMANDPGC